MIYYKSFNAAINNGLMDRDALQKGIKSGNIKIGRPPKDDKSNSTDVLALYSGAQYMWVTKQHINTCSDCELA